MTDSTFSKHIQNKKERRQLKNAAETYNATLFSKLQKKMDLTAEQEDEIVHLLSNNDRFIKRWIKHNEMSKK